MIILAKRAGALVPAIALAACSTLSGGGPSATTLRNAPAVTIVEMTAAGAAAARAGARYDREATLARALDQLHAPPAASDFRFGAGDAIDLTVWSFAPLPGSGAAAGGGPAPTELGRFIVATDGAVTLPYAGPLPVQGLTIPEAQRAIAKRYAVLGIMQRPTATVRVASSPHSEVLVTGAVGQPRQIPWTPAGLTLAQAVTQALGDGNATLGGGDLSNTRSVVRVSVVRAGAPTAEVPMATALEERIQLLPGDRIVVRKGTPVEVTMLGAGLRKNGVIAFPKQPALAEAIAEANGLDGATANDHAVFVLRRREGAKPTLYDFAWKRAEGLIAAQDFPLESGDIVYVAEAPIVPVQKVIGLLFQVTLPAQVLK